MTRSVGIKIRWTTTRGLGYGCHAVLPILSVPKLYRVTQGLKVENAYLVDIYGGQRWNRTTDTGIFSPLLYQLSYLAIGSGVLDRCGAPESRFRRHIARDILTTVTKQKLLHLLFEKSTVLRVYG